MNAVIATPHIATEIVRLHELALQHRDAAVDHARQAGRLLIEAKAAVGHGNWGSWVSNNVTFTLRTAERYMNVAAPKHKSDRLSFSHRPRKLSMAGKSRLSELNSAKHRDDVMSRVMFLIAELPTTTGIRSADEDALRSLLELIEACLGRSGGPA